MTVTVHAHPRKPAQESPTDLRHRVEDEINEDDPGRVDHSFYPQRWEGDYLDGTDFFYGTRLAVGFAMLQG